MTVAVLEFKEFMWEGGAGHRSMRWWNVFTSCLPGQITCSALGWRSGLLHVWVHSA